MDSDMDTSGLPWLDSPVMLHSSRADTCKLTPQQCEYRSGHWRYWYQADHVYALAAVYFMCAVIGVFAVVHTLSKYGPAWLSNTGFAKRLRTGFRYLSYSIAGEHRKIPFLPSASLGLSLLILAGVIYFAALTLGPKPYYWPNTSTLNYGNSPPIATRTGWMALGLLPFVLALSAKANLISAVTGIPYEKLQVFHHWTSYAMFVLALIHTFPFIVYHIQKGDMVMQWQTSVTYWTGVAALIPQAYLTFMSLPWIRNRYYEFFKSTHITVSILFIFFFFIHCDFRLTSWDYFIATGTIYIFSLLYAWTKTYLFSGLHTAKISLLPCGLIEIVIPTVTSWRPGQHVFLRFLALGLHSLTAHPFTISSVPHKTEVCGHPSEMKFYIKPHGRGFTARIAKFAEGKPHIRVRVFLEGPYSGVNNSFLSTNFDRSLVISGGSGAGFSLGLIEDLVRHQLTMTISDTAKTIQVVYATRHKAVAYWYKEKLEEIFTLALGNGKPIGCQVEASIHVTSTEPISKSATHLDAADAATTDQEKNITKRDSSNSLSSDNENNSSSHIQIHENGERPNLRNVISSASLATNGGVAVVVCGPNSMLHDARNIVSQEQVRLLKDSSRRKEVYLHTESFSW
ncbi:ferric reductase [Talaromyces proteolyticus]|uniref:ferric-chelate reductase (NADPH) n=1 Tax=Talaromyces proteolyticus TaxID=1131652 RepID=A0AAD4KL26_9EURO|nr:ferric reductase [Talaromyces proteolyticus]KAH8690853.1 ferric reductase [Talaromyces proteolyticus]